MGADGWYEINLPWYSHKEPSFQWLDPYGTSGVKGHPLHKVGVLVEVKTAQGIKRYLIGDTNSNGGGCNCCTVIDDSAQVLRAKVVYEPDTSL